MKKIVVIGGGNGSAVSIEALRASGIPMELSAVVSVTDSGGSSGRLREEFGMLPPGDILRAILAMSRYDYQSVLKPLFYRTRFDDVGALSGHNLGNLFLTLAARYDGKFISAIRALEQAVEAIGHVYPATKLPTDLVATLESGETIRTEAAIDRPTYDLSDRIAKVAIDPMVPANDHALEKIREAEYIFLGPGSLYCSVVAALLPQGIREAIDDSSAMLVYVVGNAYERFGETGATTLVEFIESLERYLPRPIDVLIHNDATLSAEQRKHYEEKSWAVIDATELPECPRIIQQSFESGSGGLSAAGLGKIFKEQLFSV